ncbi:hypothetical protein CALVIDRAFT_454995, partial [Calocera viscosa TUFC12733]
ATLFSTVVSAFIIASSLLLQPDTQTETLETLRQIAAQMASGNRTTSGYNDASSAAATSPSPWAFAVNALWLSSLVISLVSTVFAMSVKQWMTIYKEILLPGSPAWTCARHERYMALQDWKIELIVDALPTAIILAVFLFLCGLVVYFWEASNGLGLLLCILLVASLALYLTALFLPVIWPQCPYQS